MGFGASSLSDLSRPDVSPAVEPDSAESFFRNPRDKLLDIFPAEKSRSAVGLLEDGAGQRRRVLYGNFTDPESRIMKAGNGDHFEQAYKAQAAVEVESRLMVAQREEKRQNGRF